MPHFAEALKRPLWIAAGSSSEGVTTFGEPVQYRWNVRTMSAYVGLQAYGPSYTDYRVAVTDASDVDNLKAFDRVWLETTPDEETDEFATTADFYIESVVKGIGGVATVTMKRLSHDG